MNTNGKLKILYVDDEPINATVFRINFKNDFKVILSSSGKEALGKIDSEKDIDVIVSDFKMPGMNGVEFIREATERFGPRPSMILSGYDQDPEIDDALEDGSILDFFKKPMDIEKIRESILESCDPEK